MRKSIQMLKRGFQSSCGKTQEFIGFCRTFKSEFTKELLSISATNIEFNYGHFYISGFFTIGTQAWYFSLSDVRGMEYNLNRDCMGKLLYRTAKDYRDFTGGQNRYAKIEPGMGKEMCWSFQLVE
jgi:hypothetical protein